MPAHEEHLAGIEEATGRLRTLKVKFNNAENDWCEAGKQLQRVRDLRQKYIDEHGFAPPNPPMQPLLQPVQKFYTRKAKEYLAVSREMSALIAQRDIRIYRYIDFVNRESLKEETDEPGARAERERAAHRERMRQQQSARVESEERQRQEEAQRQEREEEAQRQRREEEAQRQRRQQEAQRQAQAQAEARARQRREEEQRQKKAQQEQAWHRAQARQKEHARRQRAQAQQESRKRQHEQAEQETRKRQKPQPQSQPHSQPHLEHNTTAPTKPYGTLTPARATLEWRTRLLETWPAPFYRTLQAFPAPPPIPCSASPCCTRTGTQRILKFCDEYLRKTFATLSKDELRIQRIKWHPDRFSACPGAAAHVGAYKRMAGEVFVVVNAVYEEKMRG